MAPPPLRDAGVEEVFTLLSPPETARMFPVMDQLTCQTTSLNLCSSLAVHVFPAGSSHVQMKTRPSCRDSQSHTPGSIVRQGQGHPPHLGAAGDGAGGKPDGRSPANVPHPVAVSLQLLVLLPLAVFLPEEERTLRQEPAAAHRSAKRCCRTSRASPGCRSLRRRSV